MDIHSYIKYTVHRGLPLYAMIPVTLPSIVGIQVNPCPYNGEVTSYYLFITAVLTTCLRDIFVGFRLSSSLSNMFDKPTNHLCMDSCNTLGKIFLTFL